MKIHPLVIGFAALFGGSAASAVTLPGDYGAVAFQAALKASAADGKPIMLLLSAPG